MGKSLNNRELGTGLSQLKNGLYCARFTGIRGDVYKKCSKNLKELKEWLEEQKYMDGHSSVTKSKSLLVDTWFEYWIGLKKKSTKYHTVRMYTNTYMYNIQPVLGNMLINEVKPIHCQIVLTNMGDSGYKNSTIVSTKTIMHGLFEYAKNNEVITNNPCNKSLITKLGKEVVPKEALDIKTQKIFVEALKDTAYENHFKFVLQTGLRSGELSGLKWEDVDFERNIITIRHNIVYKYKEAEWMFGTPKTKSGYRTIPLTSEALRILNEQKILNKSIKVVPIEFKDNVFLSEDGTPVKASAYDSSIRTITRRAKIPCISIHILRHTFATRCIEGGMKPKTLQKIMGHSNLAVTMNMYVTITEDEKFKEIEAVEDFLNVI